MPTTSRAHTEGFDALKAIVRDYTPAMAADICGVRTGRRHRHRRALVRRRPAALSLYCQGLNQSSHGTDNNAALIHLHLATGKIGKPGCGPFSLTGQPNAMGGREVGGMANLLSAHRDLANAEHRAEVARLWGVPDVPAKPGLTAVELFEAVQPRRDQGAVDRLHQSGAVAARSGNGARGAGALSRSSCCRKSAPTPTPPPSPTCCCRPPAGARRKAR